MLMKEKENDVQLLKTKCERKQDLDEAHSLSKMKALIEQLKAEKLSLQKDV